MNPNEALALKLLPTLLDTLQYVGIECLFAKLPIIELWDAKENRTRVIVCYASENTLEKASKMALDRAIELLSEGVAPCGCTAMVCDSEMQLIEVGDV